MLAEQFALTARGEAWDSAFDMDGDGVLRLSDFFVFVDSFGEGERAKLLALARHYLDLPYTANPDVLHIGKSRMVFL